MNNHTRLEDSANLNYLWANLIIEELVRCGVTCFCIAPGSRSAPLTVAAAQHSKTETVIHFDERGLGFYALGRVSATKQPVALICSSGTAAANFLPAIIETSKKKLPLIVLTADRPPELRHTGALQTIDQVKLYGNYTRWFTDLPAPDMHIKPEVLLTTVDQAVFLAKHPMGGPVHLNCMFREPLAPEGIDEVTAPHFTAQSYLHSVAHWQKSTQPYTQYTTGDTHSQFSSTSPVVEILTHSQRGIILVGKLGSTADQEAVVQLAEKLNWPIFPDIVSGLRMGGNGSAYLIHYYDQVLLSEKLPARFPVDTVLHLGGRITSKRLYQFIEKQDPAHYIAVLSHALRNDPLHRVTMRVKATVQDFCCAMMQAVCAKPVDNWLHFLQQASARVGDMVDKFLEPITTVNEIAVARLLSKWMPDGHGLFLSNSMPVREMDMYGLPAGHAVAIGGNRGASGIDGIIATACGFTAAGNRDTTLLIGDLAFLHDLNSLALVKSLKKRLIIVVINNDGGGIFSFLPIAQSASVKALFEPCFGTPHGLQFTAAATMFGLNHVAPQTMAQLAEVYQKALVQEGSTIIEVKTERQKNHEFHRDLQEIITKTVDGMLH